VISNKDYELPERATDETDHELSAGLPDS
jgi:hypothetical protein